MLWQRLRKWRVVLALWRRRARERGELARMSEVELKDIGIGRCAARFESNKPFWRP